MADMMNFPKTIQEFISDYSFKDTVEVYTNGSELIQVFRVEQALEHYEAELRASVIDEFAERIKDWMLENDGLSEKDIQEIDEIASQMKGEKE